MVPEERGRLLQEALQALAQGDPEPLLEGFRAYLLFKGLAPATAELRLRQVRAFLRYLILLRAPKPLLWDRGDYLRFRQDLLRQGAAPTSLLSHLYALRSFLGFLTFAGHTPPPLDLPSKERAPRVGRPLSREEYLELLDLLEGWPSRFREPVGLLLVVLGEGGLLLKEALALPVEALEASGRLHLPGGAIHLSRRGTALAERYLDYRRAVARYPTRALFLDPKGDPMDYPQASRALHAFSVYAERPVDAKALRLTGRARLVERYGSQGAKRLLRKVYI